MHPLWRTARNKCTKPRPSGRGFHLLHTVSIFSQLGLKFLGERAAESYQFSRAGMGKAQAHRVEALSRETGDSLFPAVDGVTQNGVTNVGEVDADLVGAPCF